MGTLQKVYPLYYAIANHLPVGLPEGDSFFVQYLGVIFLNRVLHFTRHKWYNV